MYIVYLKSRIKGGGDMSTMQIIQCNVYACFKVEFMRCPYTVRILSECRLSENCVTCYNIIVIKDAVYGFSD